MISHCPECGRSLQGLRVLAYDNVVLSSDGTRMIAASESAETMWRVFCAAGHDVGAGEVISLTIPLDAEAILDGGDLAQERHMEVLPRVAGE